MTDLQLDDPVETLVAQALGAARDDDRWSIAPRAGIGARVRTAATARKRRAVGLTLVGSAVLTTGAVAGFAALQQVDRVVVPAAGGESEPVAGISPEWRPASGREWLLTSAQYDEFMRTHTVPSPKPGGIASPAPLTGYSARLADHVTPVLPPGAQVQRQDALNGKAGTAGLHVTLPDGTPVEVVRQPMQYPWVINAPEQGTSTPSVADIDGTTTSYVTHARVGYGWWVDSKLPPAPGAKPTQERLEGARSVTVITRSGEATQWYAPLSVSLQQVVDWALAAEVNSR